MSIQIIGESLSGILSQVPEWPTSRRITHDEVTHILKVCDGFWMHDGDPKRPHALLTSGKHSDGFVNCGKALSYSVLCELFADELGALVKRAYGGSIDWVVASDHAAATLGYAVSNRFGVNVRYDFCEKDSDPNVKDQHWNRHEIRFGEVVLQVEELITTLVTIQAVRAGLRKAKAHTYQMLFAPVVAVLINRSGQTMFEGAPIVSLANYDIKTWEAAECPLCQQGSEAVRPKGNWAKLTGISR